MKLQARETSPGHRTGITVRTKLASIAKRARTDKEAKFCSLNHLMNKAMLREAFRRLSNQAAPGIDGETKGKYQQNLEENPANLRERLKSNTYKPIPVRRKYIPKPGSTEERPLGIPALEDKMVQTALVIIMGNIYEQDFLSTSFGFRPEKGCHDALKHLSRNIGTRKVGYVVDADIRGFFNHVDHEWLIRFLQHRITDGKILRLVKKFLKAGVMEQGKFQKTEEGVPQGGSISPLLANIYLHYVLDLWFEKVVVQNSDGEAFLTRYADDFVACFQNERDAKRFYQTLKKRLAKFGLEIAEEKSRVIVFGRYTVQKVKAIGRNKPETFDFLGFTHYCSVSKKGRFKLKWKTSNKKLKAKVKDIGDWIKENRHRPLKELWPMVNQKLRGHYQYYGVSDNSQELYNYYWRVTGLLFKWLNRRGQKKKLSWDKFKQLQKYYPLAKPKILVNLNSAFV